MSVVLEQKPEKGASIRVLAGSGIVKIPLERIVYAETKHIYLSDGGIERARMTSTGLYELLEHRPKFVRLGASFIINLDCVVRVSARDIRLTDGSSVPVLRGSYAVLKQKYFDYYAAGGTAKCSG